MSVSLYMVTNLLNHKFYIGVSKDPKRRFAEHKNGQGSKILQRAFRKYGVENFLFDIVFTGNMNCILEIERELVCEEVIRSGFCYNQTVGGGMPPAATPESSTKSAATRKRLVAEGKISVPILSPQNQKRASETRKLLMSKGEIPKPPQNYPQKGINGQVRPARSYTGKV